MIKFNFQIDGKHYEFPTLNPPDFHTGEAAVVSNKETDITFGQEWYNMGFNSVKLFNEEEYNSILLALSNRVKLIIEEVLNINTTNFSLEKYHKFVLTDEDHYKIILKTRDLNLNSFGLEMDGIINKFEKHLGFPLTDVDPQTQQAIYVIVRINRPHSNDFNPPHKDIYHFLDGEEAYIPKFVNIWIPITGVTDQSSLPLVESSHLMPENQIIRTKEGGKIGRNSYNVRMIKSWAGSNALTRVPINYGEVLFFSPHLIHGLALNGEKDKTRVSLEFRLFKKGEE